MGRPNFVIIRARTHSLLSLSLLHAITTEETYRAAISPSANLLDGIGGVARSGEPRKARRGGEEDVVQV